MLLDSNVLIAITLTHHQHHEAAVHWVGALSDRFATCPITQGSLVREVVRSGNGFTTAWALLGGISRDPRHDFWVDDISYLDVAEAGLVGHRQVTDAYLAQLARSRDGRIATFDRGLTAQHPDVAELVPTS